MYKQVVQKLILKSLKCPTYTGFQWKCWYVLHLVLTSLHIIPIILFPEVELKYDKKMRSLRDELELHRKTEIHEIEEVSLHEFRCLELVSKNNCVKKNFFNNIFVLF